jgi:hypothetical protein
VTQIKGETDERLANPRGGTRGQISAPCAAEIEKRAKLCMDDANMRGIYRDASNEGPHKDPPGFCSYRASSKKKKK